MSSKTITKTKSDNLIFNKAKKAIFVLKSINPKLTSGQKETLEILMDKHLMADLKKSLADTKAGRVSKLETILD